VIKIETNEKIYNETEKEKYLFKIVYATLEWLGIDIIKDTEDKVVIGTTTEEEIADLVMQKLINIKC